MDENKKRAKLVSFFEEFPWLSNYVESKDANEVKVSRVDYDLLERVLSLNDRSESDDVIRANRKGYRGPMPLHGDVWLLNANGDVVERKLDFLAPVVLLKPSTWFQPRRIYGKLREGETIGEKLIALGEKRQEVVYVLSFFQGKVVVYKPPKKFNLSSWIEELIRRARNEILKESVAIDAEAETEV